jgi:AraC-like DNA-binding protein/CheY-like chemotaxis protein
MRVFLVDDEVMAVEYLKDMLSKAVDGCEVAGEALTGIEALRKIEALLSPPDIAFVDISMPVMNGIQLSEQLRQRYPSVKIVLLTSYRDFEYAKKGVEIGISSYMLKNELSEEALRREIEKIMLVRGQEDRQERLYREKALRGFLLGDAPAPDETGAAGGYHLAYLFRALPIGEGPGAGMRGPVDVEKLARMDLGDGIRCTGAAFIRDNAWCAVLALDFSQLFDSTLERAALRLIGALGGEQAPDCVILSDRVERVAGLPAAYLRLGQKQARCFALDRRGVFREAELAITPHPDGEILSGTLKLAEALRTDDRETVHRAARALMDFARVSLTAGNYLFVYKTALRDVGQWMSEKDLEPAADPPGACFETPAGAERALEDWIDRAFDEYDRARACPYSRKVEKAVEFVRRKYARNISFADAARYAGASESGLRKLFKAEVGENFVDYLTRCRIEAAKRAMDAGEERVNVIGAQAGFTSSQYFCTVFKRATGMTPGEYIQRP